MHKRTQAHTERTYLLDLALLGSQVALLLLEVPEITVLVCIRFIHGLMNYSLHSNSSKSNIHTT